MKFYQTTWFCILMLILFFPVGIYLMFQYKHFNDTARIIITIIIGLIIVGSIMVFLLSEVLQALIINIPETINNNSNTNTIDSTETIEESENHGSIENETFDSDEPEPTWHDVITFEGNSIKDTQTFHISSNYWAIGWATQPGKYGDMNFQIFVYNENGSLVNVVANVIGKGSDTSYMRGKGNYYLSINTGQPYVIKISEYK